MKKTKQLIIKATLGTLVKATTFGNATTIGKATTFGNTTTFGNATTIGIAFFSNSPRSSATKSAVILHSGFIINKRLIVAFSLSLFGGFAYR